MADCKSRRSRGGPREKRRPPTPRGSSSYSSRQKVNFRVSGIDGDPQASGREGDEEDAEAAEIVDAFLAAEEEVVDPLTDYSDDEMSSGEADE